MKAIDLAVAGPSLCPQWRDHSFSAPDGDGWRSCATCGMRVNDDLYVANRRLLR